MDTNGNLMIDDDRLEALLDREARMAGMALHRLEQCREALRVQGHRIQMLEARLRAQEVQTRWAAPANN